MALSVFDNKAVMPNNEDAAAALGKANVYWESVKKYVADAYSPVSLEWKFYGKESGWTQNIKKGKRTLFMFAPMENCFQAYFTLSERAVAAIRNSDLPEAVKTQVPDDRACVCGFAFRLNVRTEQDAESLKKLIAIKDQN